MRPDLAVVLVLLGATIAMFAINRPRMDAVALMLPYAILMTVLWMLLFAAWYVLGLPWGL